ncbi:hypothetical protein [Hornefia butyriciproducens]|uniref:hypothetical protein n=1 Tax=Hornefia butyriciproducens TaxID=2652293 RepID=UPI002A91193F|nr:hypothetical protein [Hornefia butyriciproducens]MDY5463725.1 hypothetical protein [Hornefia butyriciproducens]
MKHELEINVSRKPTNGGIVSCCHLSIRERFLRLLLGKKTDLTVIVPGDSVEELAMPRARC